MKAWTPRGELAVVSGALQPVVARREPCQLLVGVETPAVWPPVGPWPVRRTPVWSEQACRDPLLVRTAPSAGPADLPALPAGYRLRRLPLPSAVQIPAEASARPSPGGWRV